MFDTVNGLAEMAPGPQLAVALSKIDRSLLNGHEMVIVLQARARLVAHDQAEMYADMMEVALLGPLCRHHHRLKHQAGWKLEQPTPGHFIWTSPLGHTYHSEPRAP